MPIADESTFVIEKSPTHDVTIGYEPCDYHGKYAMKVVNDSEIWGGLAQDGKYCFAGMNYLFHGAFKNIGGADRLRIEIYREGETSDPVAVIPMEGISRELSERKAEFTVSEEGRYTFAVVIPPHSQLLCDDFSLMPEDNFCKWKKSSVEVGSYVAPSVVRFPGGCFASFYDWHNGIGKDRTPEYSWFWGGYNYNDIGIDELAQYIEAIGAEGMYCLNVHHPFKHYYEYIPDENKHMDPLDPDIPGSLKHYRVMEKFTDLEKGAEEAVNLVEYCNGDETTCWGAKRAANGHKAPYNIKYWEMDNETWRWFRAKDYAAVCAMYAKRMKEVDPEVKIGMDCYTHSIEDLPEMLEIAGQDIGFLADREVREEYVEKKLEILKDYNKKHGTNLKYCDTEWLPLEETDEYNFAKRQGTITKSYLFSKWSYALNAARTLMMWQRFGGIVDFVDFNNWANTHSQSVIETAKEGAFVTASGEVMHLFANTKAAYVLKWEGYQPKREDEFQVQISLNEEKDALVLHIMNRTEQEEELQIDVSAFLQNGKAEGIELYADSLMAMNTLTERGIQIKNAAGQVENGVLTLKAEKYSLAEIVIDIA